jgi:hypothetical protein
MIQAPAATQRCITDLKSYYIPGPGDNVIKLFFVTDVGAKQARPMRFQASLLFAIKGSEQRILLRQHNELILGRLMDKLQLTGQNLGRVFNYTSDRMFVMHLFGYEAKLPNLKLKTRPKQLLGYLPLVFALPGRLLSD